MVRALALCIWPFAAALAAGPLTRNLYPAGGGYFAVELSACADKAAVLNGSLANHTGSTWLYIEIQVKVMHGTAAATYRLNLERVGPNGAKIRQKIEGPAEQDCNSFEIAGVQLLSAYSESRAPEKKR